MTAWNERLEATRVAFTEQLEQRGWKLTSPSGLSGDVAVGGSTRAVHIDLPEGFPFSPPKVFPDDELARSWHRERDGAMCLYPEAGRGSLPWLDADDFVATIARWLDATLQGWPADAPDMDLERYFEPVDEAILVLYDDSVEQLVDRYVRFNIDGPRITLAGPGVKPPNARRHSRRIYGYVADVGEPERPPRDWDELRDLLDPDVGHRLDRNLRAASVELLLIRYTRGGSRGVIALVAQISSSGVTLRSVPSASTASDILSLRSGRDAEKLADMNVLVVGVGAIGSFICDNLSRAGVGRMTIRDGDVLRPGNAVRHLAMPSLAGYFKVSAVKHVIEGRPYNRTEVTPDPRHLRNPSEVPTLLAEYDLVVDASADGVASAILADGARTMGKRILSASIQDEGRIVRVDVIPPLLGQPNAAVKYAPADGPEVFEAGCGDPVSMTPPYAATEAASIAARLAIQVLTGTLRSQAGEIRVYG